MKDKKSTENLLKHIEDYSKISGLEINRTKSECLLLEFQLDLGEGGGSFLGIPIVETVKILGHYFGKNKLICDFQNFYSKLSKMDKIVNIWKQRNLTLFGKNTVIKALINSLMIYNCRAFGSQSFNSSRYS